MLADNNSIPTFQVATAAEREAVIAFHRALFDEDGLSGFPLAGRLAAIDRLLNEPERWGVIWLLSDGSAAAGYTIGTWGFSVEVGGPILLIDELYLLPAYRGRGWGRAALDFLAAYGRAHGFCTLQLEVEHHNQRAEGVYVRYGFRPHASRTLYELWL